MVFEKKQGLIEMQQNIIKYMLEDISIWASLLLGSWNHRSEQSG
jgi:hypothetical protein